MTDTVNVRLGAKDWKKFRIHAIENDLSAKQLFSQVVEKL